MPFENPFFTRAGQKERLKNVLNVFNPFTDVTQVLPSGKPAPLINHPLAKIGLITAGAAAAAPATIVPVLGSAAGVVGKTFAQLSPAGKIATAIALPIATGAIVQSPKTTLAVIKAPSSLANLGGNVGKFVENPSLTSAKDIVKENPILVGGLAAISTLAIGTGAANTIATIQNTQAVRNLGKDDDKKFSIPEKDFQDDKKIAKIQAESSEELEQEKTKQLKIAAARDIEIAKIQAAATSTPKTEIPTIKEEKAPPKPPKKKKRRRKKKKSIKRKKKRR